MHVDCSFFFSKPILDTKVFLQMFSCIILFFNDIVTVFSDYDVYGESTLENQHNSLNNQTFNKPFQWPKVSVSTSHLPADQVTPGSRIYQSQSSSFPFTQSDADQLTPSSQSKTAVERNVSITCGNCGEKGHTRVNPVCPKYHTADEKARREV